MGGGQMSDSTSKYTADVDRAQGLVIGEHNTIYQYFRQADNRDLASKHIGFIPLIKDKTDGFVGRQFVFDAIDGFLEANQSGYFIIQGEPGIGKTALLAQLVKTRGYPHHFNSAPQNIRLPRQFLANACAQIIARYRLPHDSLPDGATEDSNFLLQCLEEAASEPKNRPVVLVVDALDESDRLSLPPRANLLFLPPSLPEGAFIIATSRPLDNLRLVVSNQKSLFLEPGSAGNILDIQAFIEDYVRANEQLRLKIAEAAESEASFVEGLVHKSEGNFIYLRYVLPAIAEGKFGEGTVDELPQGLAAYYRGHWDQMQIAEPVEFDEVYAPVVCMLAVAREPLTVEQIGKFTDKESSRIRRALAQWREFLEEEVDDGTRKFRVYHLSFQDFLGEQVDLKRFDRMIARYYLSLARN
jgi:hypothetical protein